MTHSGHVSPTVRVLVGDLLASDAQTLVNTVNTVGVMGKGIAAQFKRAFPDMFREYQDRCTRGEVRLGEPYLWSPLFTPWVLNFPTKEHWRSAARLRDIVGGLEYLERVHDDWGITSLAVPPLGCGEGGLEWRIVGPTLYQHLGRLGIPVELYGPRGTPTEQLSHAFLSEPIQADARPLLKLRPGAVALAEIVHRIENRTGHDAIGRAAFRRLAYFATQVGLPTGLSFGRASYGPSSPGVSRLWSGLENNGVLAGRQHGRMVAIAIGPTFRDAQHAYRDWLSGWNQPIDRVVDLLLLIDGRQADAAATIHFAAAQLRTAQGTTPSELDVLYAVNHWKPDSTASLSGPDIGSAIRQLNAMGWLDVRSSATLPILGSDR